jgi:purine nucleosidase
MWHLSVLAVFAVAAAGAASASPIRVIYDTDMDTDVDDVGALAVLHALADLGEAELLAVIHSAPKPDGPVCAQAINAWYGRESVPVGWTNWPDLDSSPVYAHYRGAQTSIKKNGSDYAPTIASEYRQSKNGDLPPVHNGVSLYRKTLAAAKDGSVVICAVGQLAALAGLLESGPDEYSGLDGQALVAQKTKILVTMALSKIPEGKDGFNWRCDLPSAAKVVNHWPTALAVMPLGASILTGGPLVAKGAPDNPCRRAYDIYVKAAHKSRSSWDLCAVLYAVRGVGPWFHERTGHRIQLDPKTAISRWREDASSSQILIDQAASDESIRDVLDNLLLRPPAQQEK